VHKHFDAFEDIDWDAPAYAIVANDPRWVLPEVDPLGAHPWYQALPLDRQVEIGLARMANIAKVGLQFENVLIRGLMDYAMTIPCGRSSYSDGAGPRRRRSRCPSWSASPASRTSTSSRPAIWRSSRTRRRPG